MVWTMPTRGEDNQGDHFLDGIGETALNARYMFDDNAKDATRHNSHAILRGSGAKFVADDQFKSALSLPGKNGACVNIPGRVVLGIDNLSVTGWVNVKSSAPNQPFFDFGISDDAHICCAPVGTKADKGYVAKITDGGAAKAKGPTASAIKTNTWVHLAVVLDTSKQTLSIYADGKRVGQAKDVNVDLAKIFNQDDDSANKLVIGGSLGDADTTLGAKLFDFRVYSIALSDSQVAAIHHNAISDEAAVTGDEPKDDEPVAANRLASLGRVDRQSLPIRNVACCMSK